MFVPSFFEVNSASYVLLLLPSSLDGCVLNHVCLVAVVFNWAFVLVSALAVASLVLLFSMHVSPGNFTVVPLDDLLHILGARI